MSINQEPLQVDLFNDTERRERRLPDNCVDDLRSRFEYGMICAASLMGENTLAVVMQGMMNR